MNKKRLKRDIFLYLKNIGETATIAADLSKDLTKIVMDLINPLEDHKHDMFHVWADKVTRKVGVKNLRNGASQEFNTAEMFYFFFNPMMVEELKYIAEHGNKK